MQSLLNSRVRTFGSAWILCAASTFAAAQGPGTFAVGAGYTYAHTNVVPGCNCFGLNGGAAEMQFDLAPHMALLADVTGGRASGFTPDGYALTQTTFMGGVRYFPISLRQFLPFADVVLGLAHTSGSLAPSRTGFGGSNAFGAQVGGGVQLPAGHHLLFVPVQVEYLVTRFPNGGTNQQNQLRLTAGVLWSLRKKH